MATKIVSVHVPEYTLNSRPDYIAIGKKVDKEIAKNFDDGVYVARAIGKDDHTHLSLDQLVDLIVETGTDKYDPQRRSVVHEEFSAYDYDFQADKFGIKDSKMVFDDLETSHTLFGDIVSNFYENAPIDRGYPVRIDLLLLYDAKQLQPAPKSNLKIAGVNPKFEKYLYRFRNRNNKKAALVGIVKILR